MSSQDILAEFDAIVDASLQSRADRWSLRATVLAIAALSVLGWGAVVALAQALI